MNDSLSAWQLALLTTQSLPVEFWRGVLAIIGAAYSLGNDTQPFLLKCRAVFYGALFGYLFMDVVITLANLTGYANLLFAIGGIGGNWLASIALEAFQEAKANWRTIVPYVWAEVKDSIPLKTIATSVINRITKKT